MRRILHRAQTKRSWRRLRCCWTCAGRTGFDCTLCTFRRRRRLPMIRAARMEGLPLTVETCPHYLHCAAEEIPDGATLFKCAPPIRSAENREQLWRALMDGTIDLIATDHSPCPPAMKRLTATAPGEEAGRFDEAWGGIPSLSTALSVLWTECVARGIPLSQAGGVGFGHASEDGGRERACRRDCAGNACESCGVRQGGGVHAGTGASALSARDFTVHRRDAARSGALDVAAGRAGL